MTIQNNVKSRKWVALNFAGALGLGLILAGCGGNNAQTGETASETPADSSASLSGLVKVDGSSTVFPITEAVAEEFQKAHPEVRVTVGMSGTGGGFKKFGAGETAVSNASRPIKDKEAATAKAKDIDFIEMPISYDGISIVVNRKNTWATCLTVEELKKIWDKGSKINNWKQVRAGFPDKPLKLYGPGTDSGTFDYFTEVVNGEGGRSRADYTASEDDNTLVQGVSKDEGALGYFGFAYYEENADKLNLVQVNGGEGCVEPSVESINTGKYAPLSRPMFIYASTKEIDRPEVNAFLKFYLDNAADLAKSVGYVPLPEGVYDTVKKRFEEKKTGSVYADHEAAKGKTLEQLFGAQP